MVFSFLSGDISLKTLKEKLQLLRPPVRINANDVDLFRLAGVKKQTAKQEADMTVRNAREQLAQCIRLLHLEDGEFTITNGHLVSKNGAMDFPVRKLVAIIPSHGTVMAISERGDL